MRNAVRSRLLAVAALVCVCLPSPGCKEEPKPVTPPPPPTTPPTPRAVAALPEPARGIVGEWEVYVERTRGNYRFAPDGTFALTFHGAGAGEARGRWKLDGRQLVLDNESSTTRLTRAGERETAELTSLTETTMTLHSVHDGEPLAYVLRRPITFVPGKADNPKVAGTWGYSDSSYSHVSLVLQGDGTALREPNSLHGRFVGHWSQSGDLLMLRGRVDYNVPSTRPAAPPHPPAEGPRYEMAMLVSADDESLVLRAASLQMLSPRRRDDRPYVLKRLPGAAPGGHASTSPAPPR